MFPSVCTSLILAKPARRTLATTFAKFGDTIQHWEACSQVVVDGSLDYVFQLGNSLHRARPSSVAALLDSRARKQSTTFWEGKHSSNISVFWEVTPCGPIEFHWHFGGMYCLHLQSEKGKVVLVLNWLSTCHEDMEEWRYSSTILDLGTIWGWVVSFTSLQLYPGERAPGTHWIGGWVGPTVGLDAMEKRQILHYRESNPGQARGVSLYRLSYPGSTPFLGSESKPSK
jgi:hypothetical protein